MSLRPLSLRFTALGSASPRFTEGYATMDFKFVSPEDATIVENVVQCEHCADAGWLRPADYVSVGTFRWSDEPGTADFFARNICSQHLVAETENFRDLG